MLTEKELLLVKGGALSGPVVNGIIEIYNKVYEFGRNLGTLIKRVVKKQYC